MESIASPANVAQNGASLLEKALSEFSIQAASIDGQLADAKRTLKSIQAQISSLRGHVVYSPNSDDLQEFEHSVQMTLLSESEVETELLVTYCVTDASLTPEYELRANTTSAEKQATLLYRASIKQTTGESWDDVALILETATPSFDTDLPTLDPWITTASDRRGSQTDESVKESVKKPAAWLPSHESLGKSKRTSSQP
ncbi:hypothetical protein PTI98_011495 [Pleurotus ostreatus]|nr:hypothetical protein PTI98_011495 [Pleurotus ostreatus]